VAPEEEGERVDRLVVRHAASLGRRGVAELFRRGAVRVGGHVVKKGARARAGDEISVLPEGAEAIVADPGAPLDVRLETRQVVVVSKPAGQPTAPVRFGEPGTLAGSLLGHYPEIAGVGYRTREPGLLHRLDTQTSGLVVAARSAAVFEHLHRALTDGAIHKKYLAVVEAHGLADSGLVEQPLAPDPVDPRRVAIPEAAEERAKPRETRWHVVKRSGRWALIEVLVHRAYRHQIRAHLAFAGHPIAGDALYGGPPEPTLGARHALHASYVAWAGDAAVDGFEVACDLPVDLATLIGAS
jgi:23S rRNA pseudouridine1911/1915/1917 synthase